MRDCLLASLPNDRSHFPFIGLDKSEEQVALNPNYFPCCQGKGLRFVANGDVRRCQLITRYNKLSTLLKLFLARWGGDHRQELHKMIKSEDLTRLREIANNNSNAGRMLVSYGRDKPSYLWVVAVAAVWRFGFNVHFVTLNLMGKAQLLPAELRSRMIVLVENLCPPWQPENKTDCEMIINYCHRMATPLWIDFVGDLNQPKTKNTTAINQHLQEKIVQLRNKAPHLHLSERGQSKLSEVMQWTV